MCGLLSVSVVKNPYRFTQLGAGWVLRDVSVHHKETVIDFLNKHKDDMIKEAVRYATEKMSPSDKKKVEALKRVPKESFPVYSESSLTFEGVAILLKMTCYHLRYHLLSLPPTNTLINRTSHSPMPLWDTLSF